MISALFEALADVIGEITLEAVFEGLGKLAKRLWVDLKQINAALDRLRR